MTALAVVYIALSADIFNGVCWGRSFSGPLARAVVFGQMASGLALAVHAL